MVESVVIDGESAPASMRTIRMTVAWARIQVSGLWIHARLTRGARRRLELRIESDIDSGSGGVFGHVDPIERARRGTINALGPHKFHHSDEKLCHSQHHCGYH